MLQQVMETILDWHTTASTKTAKKKARQELTEHLVLCRRLLLAYEDTGDLKIGNELLDRAATYMDASIKALGGKAPGEASFPVCKAIVVEELLTLLGSHGIFDPSMMASDLGEHGYQSLEAAPLPKRKEMLFESVKARFDLTWLGSPEDAESYLLHNSSFSELLSWYVAHLI